MSGPSAERTGMRPRKRHAVWPDPRVYRSNPRMNSGPRCVVAAQTNPSDGASAQSASYRCHRPTLVVFAGKVFRYRKGDRAARDEVVAYGRAAGTPEHQLDWGD
jgi:hypothetical protein